jgi:hypothetical protein
VEGAEWDLLEHDRQALSRCRQMIIETHPAPPPGRGTASDFRERLLRDGGFVEIDRHGPVLVLERQV